MSQTSSRLPLLAAVAVAIVAAIIVVRGCRGGAERPRTVPVSGTVRYRGNPVADADVAFIAPGSSRYAIGVTDDQGRFTLGTFMPSDGAVIGTHRVTVSKVRGVVPAPPDGLAKSREEYDALVKAEKAFDVAVKAGRAGVPSRYGRGDTTPLEVTVGPAGGSFDLELTDQ